MLQIINFIYFKQNIYLEPQNHSIKKYVSFKIYFPWTSPKGPFGTECCNFALIADPFERFNYGKVQRPDLFNLEGGKTLLLNLKG
jgi:hypothetical protein